jgi:hypothetical protein
VTLHLKRSEFDALRQGCKSTMEHVENKCGELRQGQCMHSNYSVCRHRDDVRDLVTAAVAEGSAIDANHHFRLPVWVSLLELLDRSDANILFDQPAVV